jgi:hypothetical protein
MAVSTQDRRKQSQLVSSTRRYSSQGQKRDQRSRRRQRSGSLLVPSLKASVVGGIGILLLMLIGLIPIWYLAFLVIPGFLVVWFSTGLLAGVLAGDLVKNSHQGGKVGWLAGFWAGVFGGLIAMMLAAGGAIMTDFGQSIVNQFTLEELAAYGLTPNTVALMGRVFGALIIYGVMGSLVSGLFSSLGGMIYPKLAATDKSYQTQS